MGSFHPFLQQSQQLHTTTLTFGFVSHRQQRGGGEALLSHFAFSSPLSGISISISIHLCPRDCDKMEETCLYNMFWLL